MGRVGGGGVKGERIAYFRKGDRGGSDRRTDREPNMEDRVDLLGRNPEDKAAVLRG